MELISKSRLMGIVYIMLENLFLMKPGSTRFSKINFQGDWSKNNSYALGRPFLASQ